MLVIGHRGAAAHAPENTLLSFEKAVELGVDLIELDVHVCSTGEVVVIHDNTVNRTTNGMGRVSDLSFAEIQEMDAGLGERIPTLNEVLDRFKGRVGLNIELKGIGIAKPVWDILEMYIEEGECDPNDLLVSSFKPDELFEFSDISEGVKLGFVLENHWKMGLEFASDLGAWSIHQKVELVDDRFMSGARSRGLKVLVWTVNDREGIRRMTELGVNGIITDRPELLPIQHGS